MRHGNHPSPSRCCYDPWTPPFLNEDGQGNITTISAGQSLVCAARLDPFGNGIDPADAGVNGAGNGVCHNSSPAAKDTGNSYWYRGQVRDGSTGNYQLGTRTYDPSTAAFTAPDAHRVSSSSTDLGVGTDPLTMNSYTYVNGNPINLMDSDGHKPTCGPGGDDYSCTVSVTAKGQYTVKYKSAEEKLAAAKSGKVAEEKHIAELEKTAKAEFDVKGILIEVAKELSGFNDIVDCVTKGAVGACVSTVISIFASSFALALKSKKLVKGVKTAINRFNDWKKTQKLVGGLLTRARSRLDAMTDEIKSLEAAVKRKRADARTNKSGGGGSKSGREGHDNGGGTCALRSFSGETLVLMADGSRKPIKDIKIGDLVLATDPITGEQAAKSVTHLWVHHDDLSALILAVDADRDGQLDRLVTTEDHPFWNATDGVWEGPEDINSGDDVLTEQWNRIEVVGLDPGTTRRDLAYNLTVEGIHTYHVGASDVLVHNTGPEDCGTDKPRRWQVGDAIDRKTQAGRDPAWSTVRARYWKNVHNDAPDGVYSPDNMARVSVGKPPLHDDLGVPMELNHRTPRWQGGGHEIENLEEVWPWEHDAVDPYRHYQGPRP